jgi:S1-C subfamily serine protease
MLAGSATPSRGRPLVLSLVLACVAVLSPQLAHANLIAGSQSQVGAWQVGAYTRGQTATFDHCSLYRVQADGFGFAVGYSAQGIWTLGLEAADWGLTPSEVYTVSLLVGATPYTATGRAVSARVMALTVAPELFAQLKSGLQFTASTNQHRYAITLDGIEAATQRVRECSRLYAAQSSPSQSSPSAAPPSSAPPAAPSALVASIQSLLARLGYDPGPATGVVGLKTNIAISAFQKSQGERGDGLPSEAVRARLEKVVAERSAPGGSPPSLPSSSSQPAPAAAPAQKTAVSSGTGFYISRDTIITNFHVINGCAELRIRKNGAEQGSARVVAVSQSDDLAALRSATPAQSFLKLRAGAPIKPAESVLVFGYPLAGALSSAGNTTLGNVTALTGLRDDSRYIQISASVQPGNSGGPAIDDSGRLMGVVVSKLNAVAIARVTGDIPQNVNFAIKVSTLASFLEAHNISYEADTAQHELSNVQRAERAETSSTQLECWK